MRPLASTPLSLPGRESLRLLGELVDSAIESVQSALRRGMPVAATGGLQQQCIAAVDRLWKRRAAVGRALAMTPRRRAALGATTSHSTCATSMGVESIELDMALSSSARALFDAVEVEWRELHVDTLKRFAADRAEAVEAPWPPAPNVCAAALRWVVEHATADHAVRLELMRCGTRALIPRLVELCTAQLAAVPVPHAAEVPAGPERCPAPRGSTLDVAGPAAHVQAHVPPRVHAAVPRLHAAALIDSARPGHWFRMYVHDQWASARLNCCSLNGRSFTFVSQPPGGSYLLTRSALERMIKRGRFERLKCHPFGPRAPVGHEARAHA